MKNNGKKKTSKNSVTKNGGQKQQRSGKTEVFSEEKKEERDNMILIFPIEQLKDKKKRQLKLKSKNSYNKKKNKQLQFIQRMSDIIFSRKACVGFYVLIWLMFPYFLSTDDIVKLRIRNVPHPEIPSVELVSVLFQRLMNYLMIPLLFCLEFGKTVLLRLCE
ncbi:hypothetical protein JTE90_009231 [Oedothorax gibbosus]|uniref:Uncharacterized protein n=1 Tax=Oedothorax gibbosus TaxID=931172 RepID=A0AAV6UPV4_9ARAC|nr:hypothetical protein JTE90_009231 [Oedothorax gibbosus]